MELMTAAWSKERLQSWKEQNGGIKGCNYLPRTAVNSTDMWQEITFDPATIREELTWGANIGINSLRVFLPYIVWEADPQGFKIRLRTFLEIAGEQGMTVMPIFFDDCAFSGKQPYLGTQSDPVPGIHNSGWTPSPGNELALTPGKWTSLEAYVKDIVAAFANDPRIAVWDLYNEPGNSNLNEQTLPLVEAAFGWAREMNPSQPLTTGAWKFRESTWETPANLKLLELSDVISFHYYGKSDRDWFIDFLNKFQDQPLLCTEWLHRQSGNTFESMLPIFDQYGVDWYIWGLVAGRTQTYYHWASKEGTPAPAIWQHDLFHPDGTLYDPREAEYIQGKRR
jgi:hypothetical protein